MSVKTWRILSYRIRLYFGEAEKVETAEKVGMDCEDLFNNTRWFTEENCKEDNS